MTFEKYVCVLRITVVAGKGRWKWLRHTAKRLGIHCREHWGIFERDFVLTASDSEMQAFAAALKYNSPFPPEQTQWIYHALWDRPDICYKSVTPQD